MKTDSIVAQEFTGSADEWEAELARLSTHSLVQSWAYGEAKRTSSAWRILRQEFRRGASRVALAQVQFRTLPLGIGGVAWVNRAPQLMVTGEDSGSALSAEVAASLRRHWVEERGFLLRCAAPVESGAAGFQVPAGFAALGADSGWASARLELEPDLEVLRAGLDSKWRNALKKAERTGLSVSCSSTAEEVDVFCRDYEIFVRDRGFDSSVSPTLLRALHANSPEHLRPLVLSATREGRSAGAVFIFRYGSGGEYLAGIANDEGKAANSGYLLLWTAVVRLRESGARFLDLGGMHPTQTPRGIYHFKAGLEGRPYQHVSVIEAGGERLVNRLLKRIIK